MIRLQSHNSGNWSFKRNPCEQPHRHHSNSSDACPSGKPLCTPSATDLGQASHAYCDFLHHHKSLLIPSKPFLVSVKVRLPPCFAQRGLAEPREAGTIGRVKAEQDWPCLWAGRSPHPCALP